jgi:hypothetical protein
VAAVVIVVGWAAPASAEPTRTLSIDPADDVGGSPTATGNFKGASLLVNVEKITTVDLKVSPQGPTGGSPVTQNGCEVVTAGACNTGQVTYSWNIPPLAYNGPYLVEAAAKFCDPLLCLSPTPISASPVAFRLGAEPKAPADVRVDPGENRSVIVSWARNAEPDMLYYALFRKDPGGADFRRLGNDIKQPGSGRPTFTDTSAAGTNGGDFVYKVVAVRNGFSGDAETTKLSKASGERTATVAPPPTTTVVTLPNGDPATPPATLAGSGVDISTFLGGQAPALPSPGPIFLDLPDTGFGETLPFGQLPGDDDIEPGEEDAVPPTPRARQLADFKRGRPLIPVAGGLILLVMAGHIRLLSVRTKAVPEKLPPGTYVARALESARAGQATPNVIPIRPLATAPSAIDVATAVANGGHHRAPPPADDVAGLPVWAEFEPVLALGLLDADDEFEDDHHNGFADHNGHDASGDEVPDEVAVAEVKVEEVWADEVEADDLGADEVEADEFALDKFEADDFGADEVGADEVGADEVGADEVGADEVGADEFALDRFEVDEVEVDEFALDKFAADDVAADGVTVARNGAYGVEDGFLDDDEQDLALFAPPQILVAEVKPAPVRPAPTPTAARAVPPPPKPEPQPEPEPFFEPETEIDVDPYLLYEFDAESQWSAEPEVFVGPRR